MEEHIFRIIIVGDTCVGKSCILLKYTDDIFKETHDVTLGVEFGTKSILIEGTPIKLQIWDTSGQESFRSITRSFYRRADAVVLAFDITARHTFDHCSHWLEEIKQNSSADIEIYLVGNQYDLIEESIENAGVTQKEIDELVAQHTLCGYIETSAKTGHNVDQLFTNVAKNHIARGGLFKESIKSEKLEIQLPTVKKPRKKCCG